MESIKIVIPRTGLTKGTRSITIDALNFKGKSCSDATKLFDEAFSSRLEAEETAKPEMFTPVDEHERINQQDNG